MALLAVPSVAVGLAALVALRRTPATPAVRVGGRVAVTGEEPPLPA
jgi:hypothetical protein